MKRLGVVLALVTLSVFARDAHAEELSTEPVVITLQAQRGDQASGAPMTAEEARSRVNSYLTSTGAVPAAWGNVGKARVKLKCPAPKTLKGVPASGFAWKVLAREAAYDRYEGTITKFVCE